MFGAIEAGGTKFVCGVGTGPGDLVTERFETTYPEETIEKALEFFARFPGLQAMGIASFGPVDLDRRSATYGYITTTPKRSWNDFNFVGAMESALRLPVGFDTDVNAAALAEVRWGAGRGLDTVLYLTIGTGVGGGAVVNGRVVHGLLHPEMGHVLVPHDWSLDPFTGTCPYHGDCLEGLACGLAMERRWGVRAETLPIEHPAWELEADYLAAGIVNWICTLSPQRIIAGGGVMDQPGLRERVLEKVRKLLNGYIQKPELLTGDYIVAPGLGNRAGVLGAMVLAEAAFAGS